MSDQDRAAMLAAIEKHVEPGRTVLSLERAGVFVYGKDSGGQITRTPLASPRP